MDDGELQRPQNDKHNAVGIAAKHGDRYHKTNPAGGEQKPVGMSEPEDRRHFPERSGNAAVVSDDEIGVAIDRKDAVFAYQSGSLPDEDQECHCVTKAEQPDDQKAG